MAAASAKAGGDVLIVDDDAILRDLVADWLEAAGYKVRKVSNCQSALEALNSSTPVLIVSDMFMPGPCGAEAIAKLKHLAPGAALIAVSGYFKAGCGVSAHEALAAGAARALAKPFKRHDFLRAVSELIGPPPA
jgi:two-component system nitrogen regulation response regulator GlnG